MAQLIVKSSSFNDVIITGPNFTGSGNLTITGSLITTGSLTATGSVNLTLTNPPTTVTDLLVISSSGQVFSTSSTAFSSPPGGTNTQIQFNQLGAFAGSNNFTFNYSLSIVKIGNTNLASGQGSFVHGTQNTASGIFSHAEGQNTKALAPGSHTEGNYTEAHFNADYAHVEGYYTVASASYQTVVGQYNAQGNTSDYFVVGAGTFANRVNGLGVNNTRTYISNSVYLPNLTNTSQNKIVTIDSAGQLYYAASESIKVTSASYALTASYAMNGGGGGGGTPPGGIYRSIQFNSASVFSGSSDLVFDENSNFILYSGSYLNNPNGNTNILLAGIGLIGNTYYGGTTEGSTILGRYNLSYDYGIDYLANIFTVGVGVDDTTRADALVVGIDNNNQSPFVRLPQLPTSDTGYVVTYDTNGGRLYYTSKVVPVGNANEIQYKNGNYFGGVTGFVYSGSMLLLTGSFIVSSSLETIGTSTITGSSIITGSQELTGSLSIIGTSSLTGSSSISGSEYILGSGSAIFEVDGTVGPLLTVNDSNSGSLFTVNDLSGMPMLDVRSDGSTLLGNSTAPSLNSTKKLITTASQPFALGGTLISTSSYDAAFFEYMVKSGSNARSGYITATWSGSTIVSSSTVSTDIGSTTGLTTFIAKSGSYIVLSGSANAADWTIKSIIRAI